ERRDRPSRAPRVRARARDAPRLLPRAAERAARRARRRARAARSLVRPVARLPGVKPSRRGSRLDPSIAADAPSPAMPKPNDLHHLAIATADIKTQIEFFSDVLGMELVALYWMHGADGCFHGFLKLHDKASIAFVQTPDNHNIPPELGVTRAGKPAGSCAPGTMQHVALNVESEADLLAMRDRIRSRGIQVLGAIDHGMCKSIYFAGPENLMLELSTSAEA